MPFRRVVVLGLAILCASGSLCRARAAEPGDSGSATALAPPASPALVAPADGATNVPASAELIVSVFDPDGGPLTVTFYGGPAEVPDFTIVALPDTQHYSEYGSAIFRQQTEWIVANRELLNIVYVAHLGDCVENADLHSEWQVADDALTVIEDPLTTGSPDGLPWGMAPGNHDQFPLGDPGTLANEGSTTPLFNQYFGVSRFFGREYYGDHYGINNDNHFDLFTAAGIDFVVLHMEYDKQGEALRADVLNWANGVLQAYSDRQAIVVSHAIISSDAATFSSQGDAIYDALKGNPNLFLMLCGHVLAEGRRQDVYNGNTIETLLADYQGRPNGGDGWLRILEFQPDADSIHVRTYSPSLEQYEDDADSEFTVFHEMAGSAEAALLGTVSGVANGGTASIDWPGRQAGTSYEWYVEVDDGTSTTTGPTWGFTSNGQCVDTADCDDGNDCTDDSCSAGQCAHENTCCTSNAECDDDDSCTVDMCDPEGGCSYSPVTCDDSNPCTIDSCDPLLGCVGTPEVGADCDDGNLCTIADTCNAVGICTGPALDCSDGIQCTVDSCDPATGCTHAPNHGATCDDGLSCTINDKCYDATCAATDTCANGLYCSPQSSCDPLVGDPLPIVAGELWRYRKGIGGPPSGWNSRTFHDSSWGSGPSGFGYGDNDDATILTDMQGGYISVYIRHLFEVVDSAALGGLELAVDFDDGFVAYINGTEVARSDNLGGSPPGHKAKATPPHEAGTPLLFPLDDYMDLLVDGANVLALQGHNANQNNDDFSLIPELRLNCGNIGASCDDGNACTNNDACDAAGDCSGSPVDCADGNSCTLDSCDPLTGCANPSDIGASCDDDNLCTEGDTCDATGACAGSVTDCDDGNGCTVDSCEPLSGCASTPDVGARCDDADSCTTDDTCDAAGVCEGSVANCDDGIACTLDSCDSLLGCDNAPQVGATCDDGDPCTGGDTCGVAGSCAGVPLPPLPEVQRAIVSGGGVTTIAWINEGPGIRYDLTSGALSALQSEGGAAGAVCLENDAPGDSHVDPRRDPASGDGYYYLIRAQDDCRSGSYGDDSLGSERLPQSDCP